ncbi:RNase H domain-containing protein [Trichonephila clavipes]|nr:RNase H domain-containing protein [Trichonephila clavipes]
MTWTTPELAHPLLTTPPYQREDASALDRFNVHRCPTRWVLSGTGIELVTRQATIRYLYNSATEDTFRRWGPCADVSVKWAALNHDLNSNKDSIWILIDSRSSIQYLKNWPNIMDSTGQDIISKLARLGQRKQVCHQWIHVGVFGNEAVDERAGRGCDLPNRSSCVLAILKFLLFTESN